MARRICAACRKGGVFNPSLDISLIVILDYPRTASPPPSPYSEFPLNHCLEGDANFSVIKYSFIFIPPRLH